MEQKTNVNWSEVKSLGCVNVGNYFWEVGIHEGLEGQLVLVSHDESRIECMFEIEDWFGEEKTNLLRNEIECMGIDSDDIL